jgi:hypothetical protein
MRPRPFNPALATALHLTPASVPTPRPVPPPVLAAPVPAFRPVRPRPGNGFGAADLAAAFRNDKRRDPSWRM